MELFLEIARLLSMRRGSARQQEVEASREENDVQLRVIGTDVTKFQYQGM